MYKAIIFDFFGVFCPDITLSWFKKTVPNFEEKLPAFEAICAKSNYGKLSKADFYKDLSALTNIPVQEIVKSVEAETVINLPLVDYAKVLKQKDYKIACLSNGTHEWTLAVINDNELGDLFDEVILSGDLGIVKPDPEIYSYTLTKLGIDASEVIFVDDRKVNVDAAEACGIRSILFQDTNSFINNLERLIGNPNR